MTDNTTTLPPESRRLKALATKHLPNHVGDEYDKINDDGDHLAEVVTRGPGNTTKTIDVNMSALLRPTPSTTGDVEMLVLEAELLADGTDLDNPHIPISDEVRKQARERIEANGHTPAWTVFDQ